MERDTAGTIVVGGGLAGLAAAVSLARRGASVTLLEKAPSLGGRAQTRERHGFHLNLGPHALYRRGPGMAVLRRLGIHVAGHVPPASGGYALDGGRLHALPVGMASLVTTGLLDVRDKAAMAWFMARLPRIDTAAPRLARSSVAQWLDTQRVRPRARRLVAALVRLTSYGLDLDRLSAGAALRQLQLAQAGSVSYLDGGWQSLVDSLAQAARDAGVVVVSGAAVEAVETGPGAVTGVRLADGTRRRAHAVVVATGPTEAAALVEGSARVALARCCHETAPVFMASLDVALARLPRPRALFALGIDRPLYFSVHSAAARLAPAGAAVLHAAMYLGSAPGPDAGAARRELEALVDLVQPGWRDALVYARFLPRLLVAHGLPTAAQGGFCGRPGPAVGGIRGLFVAGDWVGPAGLLADASLASGAAAADAVAAHVRGAVRAA